MYRDTRIISIGMPSYSLKGLYTSIRLRAYGTIFALRPIRRSFETISEKPGRNILSILISKQFDLELFLMQKNVKGEKAENPKECLLPELNPATFRLQSGCSATKLNRLQAKSG